MNRHHILPLALFPVALLLLSPFLFSACENSQDTSETVTHVDENGFTLDPVAGTVPAATTNAPLSVSPVTAVASVVGDTLVFTASGGRPPYEWGVGNTTIGIIQVKNGNPCIYVCKQLKQNSVFVTDRKGTVAAAVITPPVEP